MFPIFYLLQDGCLPTMVLESFYHHRPSNTNVRSGGELFEILPSQDQNGLLGLQSPLRPPTTIYTLLFAWAVVLRLIPWGSKYIRTTYCAASSLCISTHIIDVYIYIYKYIFIYLCSRSCLYSYLQVGAGTYIGLIWSLRAMEQLP